MSFTIGSRFKLTIAVMSMLLIVVGGIVWQSLRAIRGDAGSLNDEVMPGVSYSAKIGAFNAQYFIVLQQLSQDLDFEVRAAAAEAEQPTEQLPRQRERQQGKPPENPEAAHNLQRVQQPLLPPQERQRPVDHRVAGIGHAIVIPVGNRADNGQG